MSEFSRAYRDPKSPLTPLTPLSTNSAFTFNLSGAETLKPLMQAIEMQRAKNNSTLSSSGMISSIKCVATSKYKSDHLANINTKNTSTEAAIKIKKLSPRFVSTKISKVKCTTTDTQANTSASNRSTGSKLSPNYAYKNKSLKVPRNTLSSNTSSYEETSDLSSTYDTNSSGWTSCSSTSDSSSQSISSGSRNSVSACSNASKTSFTANSSAPSAPGISLRSTKHTESRRRIPPKLNIDTSEDNNAASMTSVLNWVWNQLSPLNNPTIYELLKRVGMQKYWDIFKREEIVDLDVFSTLTMVDLKTIGITNSNDCIKILECVRMALDFLSGLLNFEKP